MGMTDGDGLEDLTRFLQNYLFSYQQDGYISFLYKLIR